MLLFVDFPGDTDWDGLNWVEEKRYLTGLPEGGYLPRARQPPQREAVRQLRQGFIPAVYQLDVVQGPF